MRRIVTRGSPAPRPHGGLRAWARRAVDLLPEGSRLPDDVWAQRHRCILILLWLHVPPIFVFSLGQHNGVPHSMFEAGVIAALAAWATLVRAQRRESTIVAAV